MTDITAELLMIAFSLVFIGFVLGIFVGPYLTACIEQHARRQADREALGEGSNYIEQIKGEMEKQQKILAEIKRELRR